MLHSAMLLIHLIETVHSKGEILTAVLGFKQALNKYTRQDGLLLCLIVKSLQYVDK